MQAAIELKHISHSFKDKEVLKDQLEDVYLLGNIGTPVLDEIDHIPEEYYEGFQELFKSIKD